MTLGTVMGAAEPMGKAGSPPLPGSVSGRDMERRRCSLTHRRPGATGRKERGTHLMMRTRLSRRWSPRSGNVTTLLEHTGVLRAEEIEPEALLLIARKARPFFIGHALNGDGNSLLTAQALLARAKDLQPDSIFACRRDGVPFVGGKRPDLLCRQQPGSWCEHRQPNAFRMLSFTRHIVTLFLARIMREPPAAIALPYNAG